MVQNGLKMPIARKMLSIVDFARGAQAHVSTFGPVVVQAVNSALANRPAKSDPEEGQALFAPPEGIGTRASRKLRTRCSATE